MVKQTTKLINDTNKHLVLCEEASNGSQTRIKVLDPRVPDKQIPEGDEQNAVLVTSASTRKTELADIPLASMYTVLTRMTHMQHSGYGLVRKLSWV
jgi:hypothetical protein